MVLEGPSMLLRIGPLLGLVSEFFIVIAKGVSGMARFGSLALNVSAKAEIGFMQYMRLSELHQKMFYR